ncbi:MAG: DUF3575 domain-containing protein [Alistipes sp.]|nr:DUF3575 domain-containing protein [Alistipes sp.]
MTHFKEISKYRKAAAAAKALLVVAAALVLSVTMLAAQSRMVNFPGRQVTTGYAFNEIQKQTGLGIAYNSRLVKTDRAVTLPRNDMTVEEVMDALLDGTGFTYSIVREIITIKRSETPAVTEPAPVNTPVVTVPDPAPIFEQPTPPAYKRSGPVIIASGDYLPGISLPQLEYTAGYYPVENYSSARGHFPDLAVKINFLYAGAALTPNVALEFGIKDQWTINVSGSYNPWKRKGDFNSNKKLVHSIFKAEARFWTCSRFDGHYVGVYPLYARYNIGSHKIPMLFKKDYRYEGHAFGGGVSYGYHLMLSRQWGLEFSAGVGAAYMSHEKYHCAVCSTDFVKENKTFLGPTDLGIRLVFVIK